MQTSITLYLILISASLFVNCNPVDRNKIHPNIKALQNPDLFGGDILGFDPKTMTNRNAIPDMNKVWPMGTIPFVIDGNLATQRSMIISAMNQYHQKTCIRFVERTTEYDYIHISKEHGCYSFVGRNGGKQLVSLGQGCESMGTIIHELGHAVGFYHEHQRSDRDVYLNIYPENIAPNLENQFNKFAPDQNQLLVEFDFSSIMLYGPLTFSKDGKSITMKPKPQYKNAVMLEVYQKYGLSSLDIKAIQKLYKCDS